MIRKAATHAFALCFAAGLLAAAPEKPKLPEGPGKAALEKVCEPCHGVEVATSRRESKDGWNAVIDDMIQRGATGTDEEFGEIIEYLAKNFSKATPGGKINVNSATAKELSGGLDLSTEQAAAIVKYREANGRFNAFGDLAKVPGLDAAKLQAKKSRIAY